MIRYWFSIVGTLCLSIGIGGTPAGGQEPVDTSVPANPLEANKDKTPNELTRGDRALITDPPAADANAVAAAKAAFEEKFNELKNAMRDVEKLNVQFQAADETA